MTTCFTPCRSVVISGVAQQVSSSRDVSHTVAPVTPLRAKSFEGPSWSHGTMIFSPASVGELPSPKPLRIDIRPKSRFQTGSPAIV